MERQNSSVTKGQVRQINCTGRLTKRPSKGQKYKGQNSVNNDKAAAKHCSAGVYTVRNVEDRSVATAGQEGNSREMTN